MQWETNREITRAAKKYASVLEDLAIKSDDDSKYWAFWTTAKLLRAMADKIGELENGKIENSTAQQAKERHVWTAR